MCCLCYMKYRILCWLNYLMSIWSKSIYPVLQTFRNVREKEGQGALCHVTISHAIDYWQVYVKNALMWVPLRDKEDFPGRQMEGLGIPSRGKNVLKVPIWGKHGLRGMQPAIGYYLSVKCEGRETWLRAGARQDAVCLAWTLGLDLSKLWKITGWCWAGKCQLRNIAGNGFNGAVTG